MSLFQPRKSLRLLLLLVPLLGSCWTPVERIVVKLESPKVLLSESLRPWLSFQHQINMESLARVLARHPRTTISYKESLELVYLVDKEAGAQQVDPIRMLALIVVESGGQRKIVSAANAHGLMQILPETGAFIARARGEKWRGEKSLFDPKTNVRYGTWYYRHLRDTFGGDAHSALAAYNWGPKTIQDRMKIGEKLPQIYPEKVWLEERWLQKEWNRENISYFWRRLSELGDQLRNAGIS